MNACLMPVLAADGCHVTTVEGVGSVKTGLHPVQQAMVDMHGSQCGFCTPGIIVSIYTLLANNPSVEHLEEHLDGNLCRCTGYRPIWDAARSLCDDGEKLVRGPCGTPCRECPERETCEQDCNVEDKMVVSSSKDKMTTYKESFLAQKESWIRQPDQMFPSELLDDHSPEAVALQKPLIVVDRSDFNAGGTWFRPTSFLETLALLKDYGDSEGGCKLIVGNTEVGIEIKFKHAVFPRLVCPSDSISELFGIGTTDSHVLFGSCCSLSTIQHHCHTLGQDSKWTRTLMPFHDMLRWFASTQIRNTACIGGNVVNASPISDLNPLLSCYGANLVIASASDSAGSVHRRSVPISEFFLKYRTVDLKSTEILQMVEVPKLDDVFEYVKPFKQARRREDDISIVTAGMRLKLKIIDNKFVIDDISLSFGGMAPTTILAKKTMQSLKGAEFCSSTFELASEVLLDELNLPEQVPGGQASYRMTLASSFLFKFYLSCVRELKSDVENIMAIPSNYPDIPKDIPTVPEVDPSEESGLSNFLSEKKPNYCGVQKYPAPVVVDGLEAKELPAVNGATPEAAVVGSASTHQSGPLHCTGEALYTDDIPIVPGTLQASLVLSRECGGVFEAMDPSPALALPGVVGVYDYNTLKALGGSNELGPIVKDEVVFLPVGERVRTVGQVLGIVVAETLEAAELGARLVKVSLGPATEKVIVSVEDAIEASSYYEFSRHSMSRGDKTIIQGLSGLPDTTSTPSIGDVVKVSGECHSGAQEHFYLETNASLVVPTETDLTVYCSTQAQTKTQTFCASSTGTPANRVVVRMKRMGGGFGGKETRSVFASCAAAVAAKSCNRPVRLVLSRSEDMQITGTRHVFVSKYHATAQVTEDGVKLLGLDIKLYVNGGCGFDLSGPVNDRGLFHVDGCYYFPNFRCEGVVCKTAQAPHTAYRGFGGPQGMVACETVMEHLAQACGISTDEIRRTNMYKPGEATPYGMIMGEQDAGKWNVPAMWDRLESDLNISERRKKIAIFNSENKWKKRGLSLIPTRFGIAFTAKYMNQGGALVHLYTDGTVLVSHGGTEMGQGLHTKVCQVAAQAFGISINDVYVKDSSTDVVANTIPTAASMSTDMYGMATLNACRQIIGRLEPFYKEMGSKTPLKDIAKAAHMARVDLSAHGFFALDSDRCGFDWAMEKPADWPADKPENSWKGHPFNYFTQGVACTEVEIDVLSGNHKTLRSDLLVDVGSSINPAIDIGQIEGAFTQGMGWSTIEEVIHADDDHTWVRPRGKPFTLGPGTYKIPAFNDVPEEFNVSLLEDAENPFAVHSSKAIGEPPFFLGTSVYFAIKDAINAARKSLLGTDSYFELKLPATSERIRMHCADSIADKAVRKVYGDSAAAASFQPQGSY